MEFSHTFVFRFSSQSEDNNSTFNGTTNTVLGFLYFMRLENDTLYWTVFTDDDRKVNPVKKPVRLGN